MRRLLGPVAVIGVLAGSGLVPAASANIVIGQSIGGVKLGDSKAELRQAFGKPQKVQFGEYFYATSRISFRNGDVEGMLWFSKEQKTAKGITIGSSRAQLKSAYPSANCLQGPYGPGSLYCAVTGHMQGRKSYTSFLFGRATGGVEEIELGYGNGLAQELKKAGK